jgi:hypothetical protein
MQLLLRRDSLPTFLLELLEICLPRCFSSRFAVGIELVPVFGVVGQPATAIAGLAVRLAPTRLGAVDAEAFFRSHHAAFGAGFRVARHQLSGVGRKRGGISCDCAGSSALTFFEATPSPGSSTSSVLPRCGGVQQETGQGGRRYLVAAAANCPPPSPPPASLSRGSLSEREARRGHLACPSFAATPPPGNPNVRTLAEGSGRGGQSRACFRSPTCWAEARA